MNKSSILDYFTHTSQTKNVCCILNNVNQEVTLNLQNITHFQNINLRNKNTFKDIIFAKNQGKIFLSQKILVLFYQKNIFGIFSLLLMH